MIRKKSGTSLWPGSTRSGVACDMVRRRGTVNVNRCERVNVKINEQESHAPTIFSTDSQFEHDPDELVRYFD